jgi:hypothetical protein
MSEKREDWVMPEWMEPYRDQIAGDGGNGVEDLMNRLRHNGENLAFSNIIVYVMACEVEAQVGILTRLHNAGLLKEVGDV